MQGEKCELEVLAEKYVSYYNLLGEKGRKYALKRILQKVDELCQKDDSNARWLQYYNSNDFGILGVHLDDYSDNNNEMFVLKYMEMIFQRIKSKDTDDGLLNLFEYALDINEENFVERFCTFAQNFSIQYLCYSEIGLMIKLEIIKNIKTSTKQKQNSYWDSLAGTILTHGKNRLELLNLSDEFRQQYIPMYYQNVSDVEWVDAGINDITELIKYIDNPTIRKRLLLREYSRLNDDQLRILVDRMELSEIYLIRLSNLQNRFKEVAESKLKDLYSTEDINTILKIFYKLRTSYNIAEDFSKTLANVNETKKRLERMKKIESLFQEKYLNSDLIRIALDYPDLIDSINLTENLNEKTISLLQQLKASATLLDKPKSIDELSKKMNQRIITTTDRRRFQPDDNPNLIGNFGLYRTIYCITKDGKSSYLSRGWDHYRLVQIMYNLPEGKTDYFNDLVDISQEQGYITIITEGSSAYVYYPTVISKKEFAEFQHILDSRAINDTNAEFFLTQALPQGELRDENNYLSHEGIGRQLLRRSDAVKLLQERIIDKNEDRDLNADDKGKNQCDTGKTGPVL